MPIIQPQQPQQVQEQQPLGKKEAGSGFTNISRILGANVGAGTAMGRQIGAGIGQQAGQIQQGVEKSAQQFKTDYGTAVGQANKDIGAAEGYIDPNAVKAASTTATAVSANAPAATAQTQPTTNTIAKAPTTTPANASIATTPYQTTALPTGLSSLTPQQASTMGTTLQNYINAGYTGPMGLSNANQIGAQAQGLKNIGQYALNPYGQQQLLRSYIAGAGGYGQGQNVLDRTLMARSQAAQQAINQAGQQAMQTQQNILGQQAAASGLAQNQASSISARASAAQKGLVNTADALKRAGISSAADWSNNAQRISDILSGKVQAGQTGTSGGQPTIDNDQLAKDNALLQNLSAYGINTSLKVDPRYLKSDILSALTTYQAPSQIGDIYFSPEQINQGLSTTALQNLYSIAGQASPTIPEYSTNRFGMNVAAEQALLPYQNMTTEEAKAIQKIQDNITSAQTKKDLSTQLLGLLTNKPLMGQLPFNVDENFADLYNKVTGGDLQKDYLYASRDIESNPQPTNLNSPSLTHDQAVDLINKISNINQQNFSNLSNYGKQLESEQALQQSMTLQDYINSKFNISNPYISQTGNVTSGSGNIAGLNTIIRPIG